MAEPARAWMAEPPRLSGNRWAAARGWGVRGVLGRPGQPGGRKRRVTRQSAWLCGGDFALLVSERVGELDGGPGDRGPVLCGFGEAAGAQQAADPQADVLDLGDGEVFLQGLAQVVVQTGLQGGQDLGGLAEQGLACPAPEDGAQLV